MICANFHSLGMYWILSIALNIMVIILIVFGGRFFKILPLIKFAIWWFYCIMFLVYYRVLVCFCIQLLWVYDRSCS